MYTRVFGVSERSWREKCVGLRAVRRRRGLLVLVASAAVLVVLSTAAIPSTVAAHSGDDASDEVRIVARKLEDGRIEFGLQQRESEDSWGERMLPATRFFPADATVDRWLRSSPLTVHVAATGDTAATDVMVRIVARKLANGKVEFGLRKQLPDDSWSGELLPSVRMFPTTAAVGSWLQSTAISVLTTQPTATTSTTQPAATTSTTQPTATTSTAQPTRFTEVAAGDSHACGLRSDNTVACWGDNTNAASRPAAGVVCGGGERQLAFLRYSHRWHRDVLGLEQRRAKRRAGRCVHCGDRRYLALVRSAHRQHDHVLG